MKKGMLILKNIFYGIGSRLITLAFGLLIPRLLIVSFGSEVNGLLATVTQIFTYLALLEAGIGNSAVNALYKPLDNNNYLQANEVLIEAKTYYRKVSIVYGVCIIAFAVLYPLFASTSLSKFSVFGIIVLQGGGNFINYYFTAMYTHLLTANGKGYINENISLITYILTSITKIILIMFGFDVLVVQFGFFVLSILKAPIISFYCHNKYKWIDLKVKVSTKYLKQRGAFIIHELSGTIFNNTDVFIISTFCSFSMASVYTVYNLVYASLNTLLGAANGGLGFILGQGQYKDREHFIKVYDMYSLAYSYLAFVLFTTAVILIVPFVELYTAGVSDIDYLVAGVPILLTVINLMSAIRATGSLLINVSGHAENTKKRSIIEAFINLISSLILVNIFDIRGVLIGTILALLYRTNDIIIYSNVKILNRSAWYEYRNIAIKSITFVLIYIFTKRVMINVTNYQEFALYGLLCMFYVITIYLVVDIIFNIKLFKYWEARFKLKKGSD